MSGAVRKDKILETGGLCTDRGRPCVTSTVGRGLHGVNFSSRTSVNHWVQNNLGFTGALPLVSPGRPPSTTAFRHLPPSFPEGRVHRAHGGGENPLQNIESQESVERSLSVPGFLGLPGPFRRGEVVSEPGKDCVPSEEDP